MANDLLIRKKFEDFLEYSYPALKHFPKSERFTLVADIKNISFKILKLVIKANKSRNKMPLLYEIDLDLECLRTMLRMSMNLKFLPFKKYEMMSKYLVEFGKMLGGWMKKTSKN